jgi:acetyl-CoA carboxylase biotin carboxylase subunit
MFKKILIANRGEIALRVICACRELGIQTVAVYSEPDENSLHVRFADDAVCIGPAASRDSYLNVPAIISAAEITGADAIHPGYGFLSESPYMAEVCEACHIKFIGPSANVIRLLGDKARARRVMKKAGVPVLPGSDGPVDSEERGLKIAKEMGLPVIIKAAAGGGGRGMRIVRSAEELGPALKTAQREAQAAFGVGDVYIEKYIDAPRHIEFQILGDHHGNVVHLGERECSIQRRHQKLIEEAPSVALSEKVRRKLGNTVVDAARAVQYTNAGTFEFLMDTSGNIFFIEANTRLQVEHGVTELVTGVDIVKEQIAIATGARLSFKQSDIVIRGHAMECRINAEDPNTFTPSPGQIHALSFGGGPGVRVDTFAHSECTVSPYYDSLVAKVMTHGRDRAEAIARMRRVLEMTVVEGIRTTIPLHLKVLADADYQAGRINTAFMERYQPKAPEQPGGSGKLAAAG